MRSIDFGTTLLLEDEDAVLARLKDEITKLIKLSTDKALIDDIYTKLNQTHIQRLCEEISLVNEVVKDNLSIVTDLVIRTPGRFEEKEKFLKNYIANKGYIRLGVLLEENVPHSFSDWIEGGPFALDLFNTLSLNGNLRTGSTGPGERAMAIFSPKIAWTGVAEGAGDISVGDLNIEVKAKIVQPGRWHDPTKAKYQEQNVETTLTSVGIDLTNKNSLTALDYVKNYYPALTSVQRRAVAKSIVTNIFRFTDRTADLYDALVAGNFENIKKQWAISGYYNYQATNKFSGILLLDYPSQSSLYFSDVAKIANLLRPNAPQLWGSDRDMMPQINFVLN